MKWLVLIPLLGVTALSGCTPGSQSARPVVTSQHRQAPLYVRRVAEVRTAIVPVPKDFHPVQPPYVRPDGSMRRPSLTSICGVDIMANDPWQCIDTTPGDDRYRPDNGGLPFPDTRDQPPDDNCQYTDTGLAFDYPGAFPTLGGCVGTVMGIDIQIWNKYARYWTFGWAYRYTYAGSAYILDVAHPNPGEDLNFWCTFKALGPAGVGASQAGHASSGGIEFIVNAPRSTLAVANCTWARPGTSTTWTGYGVALF